MGIFPKKTRSDVKCTRQILSDTLKGFIFFFIYVYSKLNSLCTGLTGLTQTSLNGGVNNNIAANSLANN